MVWHLNETYFQLKTKNFYDQKLKTGLTKRWIEILSSTPPEFKTLYIERMLQLIDMKTKRHNPFKVEFILKLIENEPKIA